MSTGIPSLREQIEQLSALTSGLAHERESKSTADTSKVAASSSARYQQARQLEVRARYMDLLRKLGPSTSRRLADNLGVTQAAVKTRMLELRRLGLVRDLGSIKQRIYEAV